MYKNIEKNGAERIIHWAEWACFMLLSSLKNVIRNIFGLAFLQKNLITFSRNT
jgi:hypothetical protein